MVNDDRPANKFIESLRDMFAAKVVWVRHASELDHFERDGQFIGWEDSDNYLLIPGETYKQIAKFAQAQGSRFPVGIGRLWTHLANEGLIETVKDDKRTYNTIMKKVGSNRQRVIVLRKTALEV